MTEDLARASSLTGVRYGAIQRHGDSRGSFRELWRASAFPGRDFVQANLSTSARGVLRGLHLHRRQDDVWVVGPLAHVEVAATHITMNPVAVNMQCHSARRARATFTGAGVEYGF